MEEIKSFNLEKFNPLDNNMVLEASAGTGKTYNVKQIVNKLVFNKGNITSEEAINNLRKILIVTYTEKATAELKDRIRDELLNNNPNINFEVDDFNIFTIHSFCANIINEFGFLANQATGLNVILNESYYLNDFIERRIRDNDILAIISNAIDNDFDINSLSNILTDSILKYYLDNDGNKINEIVSFKEFDNNYIYDLFLNNKKSFNDLLSIKEFKDNYELLKNDLNNNTKAFLYYLENLKDFSSFNTKISLDFDIECDLETKNALKYFKDLNEQKISLKSLGAKGKNIDEMIINNMPKELIDNFKILENNNSYMARFIAENIRNSSNGNSIKYNKNFELKSDIDYFKKLAIFINDDKFKSNFSKYLSLKLIDKLYLEWQTYKLENKYQSFNDMIRVVRENVINNEEFRLAIKNKYKYAIIDEFQDTNQLQFDIFSNIFMDDNHHLIVVGDPKQSIYSFQGADLNVYQKAKEIISNSKYGNIYRLDTNYRSSANMITACNNYFDGFFNNGINFYPSNINKKPLDIKYKNNDINSLFIGINDLEKISPIDYAKAAVKKIIDFISYDENGNTNLRIKKDINGKYEYVNVSFNDIVILGRTRTEFIYIERELKRCGIPYLKYKDDSLFRSRECAHFIALLEAINCIDFTGYNRYKLKKALFTDFFGFNLKDINSEEFELDSSSEVSLINKWREALLKHDYSNLIDNIFDESKILERLNRMDKLQSRSIYKQIGDYAISYLYNNHNIDDLIDDLNNLANYSEGDISTVSVGSDFNSIRLMTIHASKGLQFSIVISVSGFKKENNLSKVYIYHKDGMRKLSFDSDDSKMDLEDEWKRLIYVAYTRSEYLLFIPYYDVKDSMYPNILNEGTANYLVKGYPYERLTFDVNDYDIEKLKNKVNDILAIKEKEEGIISNSLELKNKQIEKLKYIKKIENNKKSYKHAYTSLSHMEIKENDDISDLDLIDKELETKSGLSDYDKSGFQAFGILDSNKLPLDIPISFPKGKDIGSMLHEVFEIISFNEYSDYDLRNNELKLDNIINDLISKYNFKENLDNNKYIKDIVYNVLNANLIEINGNNKLNNYFKLSSILDNDKAAEREFNFNLLGGSFKNYCNGFIDLLFRRGNYYSILDWKSDSLNDIDLISYSDFQSLASHTDNHYSIQRVLYSYCLIIWLNEMYNEKELGLEYTFKNHFGGVYYVYIRGCNINASNGIYAKSWNSFKELEYEFNKIIKERVGK